jgi:hypothetical protein
MTTSKSKLACGPAAGNVGNPDGQAKRAVQYIKLAWPFFNRSAGADHFMWVPGDFGACGFNMQVSSNIAAGKAHVREVAAESGAGAAHACRPPSPAYLPQPQPGRRLASTRPALRQQGLPDHGRQPMLRHGGLADQRMLLPDSALPEP